MRPSIIQHADGRPADPSPQLCRYDVRRYPSHPWPIDKSIGSERISSLYHGRFASNENEANGRHGPN